MPTLTHNGVTFTVPDILDGSGTKLCPKCAGSGWFSTIEQPSFGSMHSSDFAAFRERERLESVRCPAGCKTLEERFPNTYGKQNGSSRELSTTAATALENTK